MKIKLSIKNQALTPRQKGAIIEKLEEIRAIVKGESSKPQSRGEKIDEYFSKLRYENEKYKENWLEKTGQEVITLDELYAQGITPQEYRSLKNRGHIIVVMRGVAGYRPTLIDANSPYFHQGR